MGASRKRNALRFVAGISIAALVLVAIGVAGLRALSGDTIADRELGQPDFFHNGPNVVDAQALNQPFAVAIDRSISPNHLYVADWKNNRVLGYASVDALSTGASADLVIGQMDFESNLCNQGVNPNRNNLCQPVALAVDSTGDLFVADNQNHRLLEYNKPFAKAAAMGVNAGLAADWVLGQGGNFTSNSCNRGGSLPTSETLCYPGGIALDSASNLYVADGGNNRILEYDHPFNTAIYANRVFGQLGSFVTNDVNKGGVSADSLWSPGELILDAANNLLVADGNNSRVLRYTTPLTKTATPGSGDTTADLVFGEAAFDQSVCGTDVNRLCDPIGVSLDSAGRVYVADTAANRVVEFDPPFSTNPGASRVFGQAASFTIGACNSGVTPSSGTLCNPTSLAFDSAGRLYVADSNNNRVFQFSPPFGNVPVADLVLGQADALHNAPDSVDPSGLYTPTGIAVDRSAKANHLYVADFNNSRVLGYRNAASFANNGPPDLVIGQPDFYSSDCNHLQSPNERSLCNPVGVAVDKSGNLFVADLNNSRILEYSSPFASGFSTSQPAKLVFGQKGSFTTSSCNLNNGSTASADGLCNPAGVAVDKNGVVYISDNSNHRGLQFTPPFGSDPTASAVLGQGDFASTNCNRGGGTDANTLCHPNLIAADASGNVYIADADNSRVLEYDAPISSGGGASRVYGQPSFTSGNCNNNGLNAGTLCAPHGVALDGAGRLYIADSGNSRILEFDKPLTAAIADRVFGQGDNMTSNQCNFGGSMASADSLCNPNAVGLDNASNLYVADQNNNRVVEYDMPIPLATPTKSMRRQSQRHLHRVAH